MKRRHVILDTSALEEKRPAKRGARPKAGAKSLGIALAVDDIEPAKAAELAKRANVRVAPAMPMKLIEPVMRGDNLAPLAAGSTWGVKAVGAESSRFTGAGTIVAVLDTGIDPAHPAFAGVQLTRKNFTTESDNDIDGHGTHCAGTIFGRDVSGTRIGVASGVTRAVIGKVLGDGGGGSDVIMKAIQWAIDEGANIISMSLGIDFPGFQKELEQSGYPKELATSIALEGYRQNVQLFERLALLVQAQDAFDRTCVLVAAAGNESRRDVNPDFEIAVSPPAVADGFISVAALGESPQGFEIAPFSNVGARVSGPGVAIRSAKRGGGLTGMSGTSMATPHVAGVAALWAEQLKEAGSLTTRNLFTRVTASATQNSFAPGSDPWDVGLGMVQAPQ